mgnify:CR=1 FL=1
MNENNIQSSYYAIIPAYIRYNKELKFTEEILFLCPKISHLKKMKKKDKLEMEVIYKW